MPHKANEDKKQNWSQTPILQFSTLLFIVFVVVVVAFVAAIVVLSMRCTNRSSSSRCSSIVVVALVRLAILFYFSFFFFALAAFLHDATICLSIFNYSPDIPLPTISLSLSPYLSLCLSIQKLPIPFRLLPCHSIPFRFSFTFVIHKA